MKKLPIFLALCLCSAPLLAQTGISLDDDFSRQDKALAVTGRGACKVDSGVLHARNAYAVFGDPSWKNYVVSFRARAPKTAEQVQIWAGFHTHSRFDRYVVGIKGGLQDDIYLMRTGYMGMDEFMGVRPLGFHPVPGEWYKLRVEVCGNRIRVFVNDNKKPHIDVTDPHMTLAPAGGVALGGGWIDTEFDDLHVSGLADNALGGVARSEYNTLLSPAQKEEKRRSERAAWKPVSVGRLDDARTEINLDGKWLFMPGYELNDEAKAVSAATDDSNWHVMQVPDFWNPIRIWLHGETMNTPNGKESKGVSDTYYQQETARCENYTFDYRKTGSAWYRQWIELPEDIKGRQFVLSFDAVSKLADVYVNGHKAGSHIGMFADFQVDATQWLHPGRNLIVVKVTRDINGSADQSSAMENYYASVRRDVNDNRNDKTANKAVITDVPHGFYQDNPAGIWQPVKLIVRNRLHIDDVFIKPNLTGATFDVTVRNDNKGKAAFAVRADIVEKATGKVLYSGNLSDRNVLKGAEQQTYTYTVNNLQPRLWEPESPNLYDFRFSLVAKDVIDRQTITSGFRTFEARKDGFLYLNGRKYWLRGGNHIPSALCPNDSLLADRFMKLMREGNVNSTRTHTSPWNELWTDAADRNGILVSFEGTWSWLMIHSTPIPDERTLNLWRGEWLQLIKKYRNHPSVVFWTVNNEMKFYDLDADKQRAEQKFRIISDVVKDMRKTDPTRPMCFDSNYMRVNAARRFGKDFLATVDDGDIDDNHAYYNWYDFSLFRFFNGEFQKQFKFPGRPLISQEMSTGYPNNETGHPTRSYQLIHQNPFSLIGYEAYDWADPSAFLKVNAFTTGELAEALRRTGDQTSGIMHFAYMTWFRQCYDARHIAPWPAYYALKRALQPVLVSAELWGRNVYAGSRLATRFYVVNDDEKGHDLRPSVIRWSVEDTAGKLLSSGSTGVPAIPYYGRTYVEPDVVMPVGLPAEKINVKLRLALCDGDSVLSRNEYDLLLARRDYAAGHVSAKTKIVLLDGDNMKAVFDSLGISTRVVSSVKALVADKKADLRIVSGLDKLSAEDAALLAGCQAKGGNLLFLNSNEAARTTWPQYIKSWITPTEGDIVVMERSDAPVFDGIDVLGLRYFNNNRREIPTACHTTLHAVQDKNVVELASQMKIHSYFDEKVDDARRKRIESMRGLTMLQINNGRGKAIVSTMCTDKAGTDPTAARLLVNMINVLLNK